MILDCKLDVHGTCPHYTLIPSAWLTQSDYDAAGGTKEALKFNEYGACAGWRGT